jgi:hypothetical protein
MVRLEDIQDDFCIKDNEEAVDYNKYITRLPSTDVVGVANVSSG